MNSPALLPALNMLGFLAAVIAAVFGAPLLHELALPLIDMATERAYGANAIPLAREWSFWCAFPVVFILIKSIAAYGIATYFMRQTY